MASHHAKKTQEDPSAPKKSILDLLKKLSLQAAEQDTAEPSKPKPMDEFKFWKTQPVTKFDASISAEGPIDTRNDVSKVRKEPYPMLPQFEWVTLDVDDSHDMDQLYELLYDHYVEDQDSSFRFAYNRTFFNWALKPPGWRRDWHVGVRVRKTGRLVAFISGVPASLNVRGKQFNAVEINFLCVHKQLRNKRLAPILIKEITRRVHLADIWYALYTSGTVLPSPVSTCRYTHRPLNWAKLCDVGFSALPENTTKAQMVARYALPPTTRCKGLRKMTVDDVDQVHSLYTKFQKRFDVYQTLTKPEIEHWLLGDEKHRLLDESDKVIVTYVVENDGRITDFISFYVLPFTVLNNEHHNKLGIAYLYYYGTETGLDSKRSDKVATESMKQRLEMLVSDALIIAKRNSLDVFNALTSQENVLFLEDLKFGPGDGFLNYYLFNYQAFPINGGFDTKTKEYDLERRSGMGVVML